VSDFLEGREAKFLKCDIDFSFYGLRSWGGHEDFHTASSSPYIERRRHELAAKKRSGVDAFCVSNAEPPCQVQYVLTTRRRAFRGLFEIQT
jgi:hypothetical protein